MKKLIGLFVLALSLNFVSGAVCNLDVDLIYQDPHPAIPGGYVDLVFQVTGVENPKCGPVRFRFIEKYPFSLDPVTGANSSVLGGLYFDDFAQYWNIPYRVRIDENALEGDNDIEVEYFSDSLGEEDIFFTKEFEITVEDVRTDFEVSIKNFERDSNTLTFEILNIGEHDAEALTVEIPKQDGIDVKGARRSIVGDLDSNDDTTFSFEAVALDGEFDIFIAYTDEISVRHDLEKKVEFDSSYFTGRKGDEIVSRSGWFYVSFILLIAMIVFWVRGNLKKRREKLAKAKMYAAEREREKKHHSKKK